MGKLPKVGHSGRKTSTNKPKATSLEILLSIKSSCNFAHTSSAVVLATMSTVLSRMRKNNNTDQQYNVVNISALLQRFIKDFLVG